MEDKVKHRIVGAFVLLALFAIFIPLTFKNQSTIVHEIGKRKFQIPTEPSQKNLTIPEFKPEPVARIDLDKPSAIKPLPFENARTKLTESDAHHLRNKKILQPSTSSYTINKQDSKTTIKPNSKQYHTDKRVMTTPKAWVIQLASFADPVNAKSLENRLRNKGYNAFTSSSKNSKGTKITRLFVGPEIKRQKAEQILIKLAELTHTKGIVVNFDPREKTA